MCASAAKPERSGKVCGQTDALHAWKFITVLLASPGLALLVPTDRRSLSSAEQRETDAGYRRRTLPDVRNMHATRKNQNPT